MLGVSARGYAGSLEPGPVGVRSRGTSKSAVSRTLRGPAHRGVGDATEPASRGSRTPRAVPRRRRGGRADGDRGPWPHARRREGAAGAPAGVDGERDRLHGAAPGSAGARAEDRGPRVVRDRRRQGAAPGAAGRARHGGGDPALPTPQSPQPAGAGAEGAPSLCPRDAAAGVPRRQRGGGSALAARARHLARGQRARGRCREACAKAWRKRSRC